MVLDRKKYIFYLHILQPAANSHMTLTLTVIFDHLNSRCIGTLVSSTLVNVYF